MALAWLHMFITNEKQRSVHSPCAIISRLQSQIVQIRGAFSYCGKDSDLQFKVIQPIITQFLTSSNTGVTHSLIVHTSNQSRIGDIGDITFRKKHVMSRAPVFEGSNWNVTGTETWISGTATWWKVTPKVMLRECLEEVVFLDMVRSVESGQKLPQNCNDLWTSCWSHGLGLRCRVSTRLIATKNSVELLMNMEAVAELATRASHLWNTKAGKAPRSNHCSKFRCHIRPHAGVTIGTVTGKRRDLQQCRKCPEGASTCNATAIQMSQGCLASNGMHWMHHVAPPTLTFWCKFCVPRIDGQSIRRQPPLHCPNPLACPGGLLSANGSTPMCTKGRVKKHEETGTTQQDRLSQLPDSTS